VLRPFLPGFNLAARVEKEWVCNSQNILLYVVLLMACDFPCRSFFRQILLSHGWVSNCLPGGLLVLVSQHWAPLSNGLLQDPKVKHPSPRNGLETLRLRGEDIITSCCVDVQTKVDGRQIKHHMQVQQHHDMLPNQPRALAPAAWAGHRQWRRAWRKTRIESRSRLMGSSLLESTWSSLRSADLSRRPLKKRNVDGPASCSCCAHVLAKVAAYVGSLR